MEIKMKRNNPTRYSNDVTVRIPFELISDFNCLCYQYGGIDVTDEEFVTYVLTEFIRIYGRNVAIRTCFDI
jgi:hypothetical protein